MPRSKKPPIDMSRDAVKAQLPTFRARLTALTPREHQIAEDILLGFTAEESAQRHGLAKKTIDVYRLAIYRALGVRSAVQLVRIMTLVGY
jgi:DNA-binding NarL/FixJ family response regulator